MKKLNNIKYYIIVFTMLYIAVNIISDFLFFRQVTIVLPFSHFAISPSAAAVSWPLTYILSDAILVFSKRKIAIFVVLFGTFCDALFGLILQWKPEISMSGYVSQDHIVLQALNILRVPIWTLVYTGIISTLITAVLEIIIFSTIYKRLELD